MEVILFNLNDPRHTAALEQAVLRAFEQFKGSDTVQFIQAKDHEEKWNTDQVCLFFGAEKPVKAPTVYKYQRELFLPYLPGKPNTYYKSEVLEWESDRRTLSKSDLIAKWRKRSRAK